MHMKTGKVGAIQTDYDSYVRRWEYVFSLFL